MASAIGYTTHISNNLTNLNVIETIKGKGMPETILFLMNLYEPKTHAPNNPEQLLEQKARIKSMLFRLKSKHDSL